MPAAPVDWRKKAGLLLLVAAGLTLLLATGLHLATPKRFTAESLLLLRYVVYGEPDAPRPSTTQIMEAGEKRLRASLPHDEPGVALKRRSGSANLFVLSASATTPQAAVAEAGIHTRQTFDRYVEIYRVRQGVTPPAELPSIAILKMPELPACPETVVPWRGVLAAAGACTLAGLGVLGQARPRFRPTA